MRPPHTSSQLMPAAGIGQADAFKNTIKPSMLLLLGEYLENVAEASGDGLKIYQLYVRGDWEFICSHADRAIKAGYDGECPLYSLEPFNGRASSPPPLNGGGHVAAPRAPRSPKAHAIVNDARHQQRRDSAGRRWLAGLAFAITADVALNSRRDRHIAARGTKGPASVGLSLPLCLSVLFTAFPCVLTAFQCRSLPFLVLSSLPSTAFQVGGAGGMDHQASMSWGTVAKFKQAYPGIPLVIKGILSVADARRCVQVWCAHG